MNQWNAEADIRTPRLGEHQNETQGTTCSAGQRLQPDERYDLHNYIVLDSLLKDHLNLL
jgi:hypothetical protein